MSAAASKTYPDFGSAIGIETKVHDDSSNLTSSLLARWLTNVTTSLNFSALCICTFRITELIFSLLYYRLLEPPLNGWICGRTFTKILWRAVLEAICVRIYPRSALDSAQQTIGLQPRATSPETSS